MGSAQTVFVVDDNAEILKALSGFLRGAGLSVETFDSAKAFMKAYDPAKHGCLILDIHMPEMSGLELQEMLRSMGASLPIIVVSGHATVMDAVKAMKLGSFEFIEKPYSSEFLLKRVNEALEHDRQNRKGNSQKALLQSRYNKLTPREKEILTLVISGQQSKAIADKIGLSVSTVDNHRANIMKKLEAGTSADLARIAFLTNPNLALPDEE